MKMWGVAVVCLAVGVMLTGTAVAGSADSGKELYKQNCKVCHGKGSKDKEYTPMTLIVDQWKRFFSKKYEPKHKDLDFPGAEGKKVTDVITPEMLKQIEKFAEDHAADSEHPMTCG